MATSFLTSTAISKLWPASEIPHTACFYTALRNIVTFLKDWDNKNMPQKLIWPTMSEMFTIWSFTKNQFMP